MPRTGRPGIDITEQKFGVLVAKHVVMTATGRMWHCVCKCGNVVLRAANALTRATVCCGRRCRFRPPYRKAVKHGMFGTPEYTAWIEMRRRCNDPRRKDYKNYGGRGIRVCKRWDNLNDGFKNFLRDVGRRPSKAHSLGRRKNDGYYGPRNCCWQTVAEQNANKRNSLPLLTYQGKTQTLVEWATELNVPYSRLRQRLSKHGWSPERTLSTP